MVETINPDMWIPLQNKYKGSCVLCGIDLEVGEDVLWKKGQGVKHKVCEEPVISEIDTSVVWKDDKEYTYEKLRLMKKCQRCDVELDNKGNDTWINCGRRVCEDCFTA